MPEEKTRRRDLRAAGDDDKTPDKAKSKAPDAKKKTALKKGAGKRTAKSVGRSIKVGGATTVEYTKKAVDIFNAFTHASEADMPGRAGIFRSIAGYFARMTFPAFLLLSSVIVLLSVMAFSNSTITVDRQTISIAGLPKELEGYTILHLSDLHGREFGSKQHVLLRTINEESYNVAIFSGDMVGASGNAQPFYDLLDGLSANRKRYFISGDSDPSPYLTEPRDIEGKLEELILADWALGAQERGCTMLERTIGVAATSSLTYWLSPQNMLNIDLNTTIKQLEEQINIEKMGVVSGVQSDKINLPFTSYRYNQMLLTLQASGQMKPTDLHIAVSHIPPSDSFMAVSHKLGEESTISYLPTIDLVLSGHYCGGVWRMPFVGALYIPDSTKERHGWFPSQQDVSGVKSIGRSIQYTTTGLGVTDKVILPNFRLLNSPQVSLITLTAAITDNLLGD